MFDHDDDDDDASLLDTIIEVILAFILAIALGLLSAWLMINAITGCDRLDPDACVMVPWIER